MTEVVLVTGATGLVGTAVVDHLAGEGRTVVATDLDTPDNRRKAARWEGSDGVSVHWADLTDHSDVEAVLEKVEPSAIVHLAAVIPPFCYGRPGLARTVNVDATAGLSRAAATRPRPPRIVLASSVAVYGPRNPVKHSGVLTSDTPVAPYDMYGQHKVEAEQIVRDSGLDWVILRLGGVLTVEAATSLDKELLSFASVLPRDGRIQTVDVRDVARAFAAATTTPATGEVFLIGGDESHRQEQARLSRDTSAAMGLPGAVPAGLPGDPDQDLSWFATDWVDTTRSQEVLDFQRRSLPQMYDEIRSAAGWRRHVMRPLAPAVRWYLGRMSLYDKSARVTDPWSVISQRWGDAVESTPGAR
ncbi:NAD(P)-dependent oxidoreductase [uncultured Williamsia sp.]|uniref:NAD-dependent epimerase/dehydratase family protein n=1 Tax=uncultured Williamsia sp. TaxID=259311 RepID=UPI00262D2FFF|nr:NAD(P)-dependent oxidoreductase [uncultured Williamsia sp.]